MAFEQRENAGIRFITNNVEALRILNNQNVGIGTSSPSTALYVKRTSGNSGIYTDYNGTNIGRIEAASNGNLYIGLTTGSGDIAIGNTANATAVNLTSAGNFGIGTSSPAAKLHVSGAFGSQLRLQETSGTFFDIAVGGRFDLKNNAGTTIVSIAQSGAPVGTQLNLNTLGDLGLGYVPNTWYSTFAALQFGGSGSSLFGRSENNMAAIGSNVYVDAAGSNTYIATNTASYYQQLNGQHQWYSAPSGTAGTGITFTERMTLTAAGALNTLGAITQNGSQVLHAGNVSTYALPIGGGTLTGALTIGASGNTRGVYNANGDFFSFYSTEAGARIQLGRDVGVGGGAGLAFGGSSYALIGTGDTAGTNLYVKLATNAGSITTSPSFQFTSSGFYVGTNLALHAGNYSSYSPALSGSYANPSWITSLDASKLTGTLDNARVNGGTYTINITGNAGTATTATNQSGGTVSATTGAFSGVVTGNIGGNGYARFNAVDQYHSLILRGTVAGSTTQTITAGDTMEFIEYGGVWNFRQVNALGTNTIWATVNTSGISWNGNTVLHAGNYNSYAPTLTGTGASGTWGISVTGSSASTTGNAATATALQTARTIGGVSFNGTANINLPGVNTAGNQNTTGTAAGLTDNSAWMLSRGTVAEANIDTATANGFYSRTNTGEQQGLLVFNPGGSLGIVQMYFTWQGGLQFRNKIDSATWNAFKTVLTSLNYNTYSPTLTGTGASGSWGISVTGTANNITAYTINQNLGTGNQVQFDSVITTNNGNGTNIRVGDDVWIGDANVSYAMRVQGIGDATQGYIIFGNSNTTALGRNGTGALTYGGNAVLHAGNYNTYAPTLTGTGASGTWGISVTGSSASTTGNAATVTNATFYRQFTVRDDRSDGSNYSLAARPTGLYSMEAAGTNGPGSTYSSLIHVANGTDVAFQIAGGYVHDAMYFRGTSALQNGTGYTAWRTVIHNGNYSSYALPLSGGTMSGDLTATRIRGVNSLVLNTYTTVNPTSNVYLYSQPNDRDSWIYLDSADTGSNWGIYHRQIDSAVSGLPGNSIGFIGGGSNTLQAWISLANGSANFLGALTQGGNQVLHAGNYNSYALPLTGGTLSGVTNLYAGSGGNSPALCFGSETGVSKKAIYLETYWLVIQGHQNEGIKLRTTDAAGTTTDRFIVTTTGATINGSTVLHAGNYTSYSPTLTGGSASGTWGISVTGSARSISLPSGQTEYTILDGPGNGPVIKVRYDGATANRYIDIGSKDGYGTFSSGLKVYNGDTLTMNGSTVLRASNYNSYALPLTGGTLSGALALSDSRLYLRTNGDTNHYLWNADDDWEEMVAYSGTGFRVKSSTGTTLATFTTSAVNAGVALQQSGNQVLHAGNVSSYALPIGGGTLTSSTKIKAGHGDTRFQLHYNHDNADTTSGYAGYLTLWASEPGMSYAYTGIGGNINIGGNYYGRQTSGQAYGLYLRFETASGFSEFWATTGAVGSAGGQGSRVAYIDAAGNSVFSGNVTAYSDERLKKDWVALPADFIARLATVKSGTYTRVDSGARQAGSSAQDWKTLLPEVVSASNDEAQTLSLAYGNAALVSAVELAKEVVDLRNRVAHLESLIHNLIGD